MKMTGFFVVLSAMQLGIATEAALASSAADGATRQRVNCLVLCESMDFPATECDCALLVNSGASDGAAHRQLASSDEGVSAELGVQESTDENLSNGLLSSKKNDSAVDQCELLCAQMCQDSNCTNECMSKRCSSSNTGLWISVELVGALSLCYFIYALVTSKFCSASDEDCYYYRV